LFEVVSQEATTPTKPYKQTVQNDRGQQHKKYTHNNAKETATQKQFTEHKFT